MNTAHLYEFMALANAKSYTRAAGALYISQSVLSRHIQELERELGVALLTRSSHEVALTEAGRVLLRDGPALLRKYEGAMSALRTRQIRRKGRLRIGIGLEFSYSRHIREFLQHFSLAYPEIELQYDVFTGSTPSSTVLEYDLFFSPCVFPDLPAGVRETLSGSHSMYAVLPPNHPLMACSSIYLHQLRGETMIVPHADELFGPYAQDHLLTEKATRGQVSCIKVADLSTAIFLVSMGKGICLAPHYVQNLLTQGTFTVSVSDANCRFDEHLYLCTPEDPAAELFYQEYEKQMN